MATVEKRDTDIRWYSAVALFKSEHVGKPRKRHLWERTIFLLRASGMMEAVETAERIAREQECDYVSASGDTVHWTFQSIEDVLELLDNEVKEETEVYWKLFERVDKNTS